MDRESVLKSKVNLSAYKEIVEKYLPAVLVKCTKFTNSKRFAEIIAFYTFTGAYRLTEKLDGPNKIPVVLDSMLNIVGPDYADKPGKMVGDKLFKRKNKLIAAKKLAELDIEECINRIGGASPALRGVHSFDRNQLDLLAKSVMDYLTKQG